MLVPHRALFSRTTSASRYNDAACLKEQPSLGYCAASRVITRLRASCAEPFARPRSCYGLHETMHCHHGRGVLKGVVLQERGVYRPMDWTAGANVGARVPLFCQKRCQNAVAWRIVYAPLTFLEKTDI
jgi:hypothetical protein